MNTPHLVRPVRRVTSLLSSSPGVLGDGLVTTVPGLRLVVSPHPDLQVHQRLETHLVTAQQGHSRHSEAPLQVNGKKGKLVETGGSTCGVSRSCQSIKHIPRLVLQILGRGGELPLPPRQAAVGGPPPPHYGTVRWWRR